MSSLAVYVVDDDEGVRAALLFLFAREGIEAEGFASAREFLDTVVPESVGCLVLDLRMPEIDGLELQRRLLERGVDVPIVFLTGYGDVSTSAQAFRSGAFDFLEKPVDVDKLLETVKAALQRASQARDARRRRQRVCARIDRLTAREREIMEHVVAGRSSKEIARVLGVSHRTVEVHRAHIMKKTGAGSLSALVKLAMASGLAHSDT